jgi:anti-sigma-K factor RskA
MTAERLRELLSAYALGALDADERALVEKDLEEAREVVRELAAWEEVVGRLGLQSTSVPPSPALRDRVLREAASPAPAATGRVWTWLATAAALFLAIGLLVVRAQRDQALREAAATLLRAETAEGRAREALAELEVTRVLLAREQGLRDLLGRPATRLVSLGGQAAAPRARARVVFDPSTREAFLLVSGLDRAPEGKAYQVWVIATGAPVPAGVFQVEAEGRAVFRLSDVAETSRARTFAVTLEPAAGVPAPTGPMVVAGSVS